MDLMKHHIFDLVWQSRESLKLKKILKLIRKGVSVSAVICMLSFFVFHVPIKLDILIQCGIMISAYYNIKEFVKLTIRKNKAKSELKQLVTQLKEYGIDTSDLSLQKSKINFDTKIVWDKEGLKEVEEETVVFFDRMSEIKALQQVRNYLVDKDRAIKIIGQLKPYEKSIDSINTDYTSIITDSKSAKKLLIQMHQNRK